MKKFSGFLLLLVAIFVMLPSTASAALITLVSVTGNFNPDTPNQVLRQSFVYDPSMGPLDIQTYGYGGSSNAPGGTNATGSVIPGGGFDTIVGLFAGGIGGGGARIDFNDDGVCGPGHGATSAGICFDSTLHLTSLAAGMYTVSLSTFSNFPGVTETSAFSGGGSFNNRTTNYALDVTAGSGTTAVPEPATLTLFGTGIAALVARRRKSKNLR